MCIPWCFKCAVWLISACRLFQVALKPRKVAGSGLDNVYRISSDMRISIHGSVQSDIAHVMTVFLQQPNGGRTNILNLDYNGARDVGCMPVVTGHKHSWSCAMPSAIDDDDEDNNDEERDGAGSPTKKIKMAMDSVA